MATPQLAVEHVVLSDPQRDRIATALAVFDAQKAALQAGMSLAEVQSQDWLVDGDSFQARAV